MQFDLVLGAPALDVVHNAGGQVFGNRLPGLGMAGSDEAFTIYRENDVKLRIKKSYVRAGGGCLPAIRIGCSPSTVRGSG